MQDEMTIHERSSDGPENVLLGLLLKGFFKDSRRQTKSDVITSDQSQQTEMTGEPMKTVKFSAGNCTFSKLVDIVVTRTTL